MPNFDRPPDLQFLAGVDGEFTGFDGAKIRPCIDLDVAVDFDVSQVEAVFVCAGGHASGAAQGFVGDHPQFAPARQRTGDGAEAAGVRAHGLEDFLGCGCAENGGAEADGEFGLVQLVVAANEHDDRLAFGDIDECFDLVVGLDVIGRGRQRFDGDDARRCELFRGGPRARGRGGGDRSPAGRFLNVRRVRAGFAVHHFILAGLGGDHELVRVGPSDHARVGFDGEALEPAAIEDALIGVVHAAVAFHGALLVHVEAVGVLHDELLCAHEAEARADFVAELDAHLVEVYRHLPVGIEFGGGDGGDDFLCGGAEHPFLFRAVAHLVEHVCGGFIPAGLLPDVGWLQRGHQHFDGACAVHFFADDVFDLAQGADAEREKGVEAAGEFADQPGA